MHAIYDACMGQQVDDSASARTGGCGVQGVCLLQAKHHKLFGDSARAILQQEVT